MYTGRAPGGQERGLTHRVVTDLVDHLYGQYTQVYFDNFYMSPDLLTYLHARQVYACGTVRANRKNLPTALLSKNVALQRYEFKVAQKDELSYVVWQDTKPVCPVQLPRPDSDGSLVQQKVKDECSCQILNIGSCGLHIVHVAFTHGCNATKWVIAAVLRSTHSLFSETPARRKGYTKITGSDLFGKNFCNTRWLENVPVAERLLEMFPHLCKYVAVAKKGDFPLLQTKVFGVVSEATSHPLFPVKLNCFVLVAKTISPFLLRYQTDAIYGK